MGHEMGEYASYISEAFKTLVLDLPANNEDPPDDASMVVFELWRSGVRKSDNMKSALKSLRAKLFLKVEGQCTKTMKGKIKSHDEYKFADTAKDGFALLKIIEGISIGIEAQHNKVVTSQAALVKYLKIHQGNSSLLEYHDKVKSSVVTMKRARAQMVTPYIVAEIAAANGHARPECNHFGVSSGSKLVDLRCFCWCRHSFGLFTICATT